MPCQVPVAFVFQAGQPQAINQVPVRDATHQSPVLDGNCDTGTDQGTLDVGLPDNKNILLATGIPSRRLGGTTHGHIVRPFRGVTVGVALRGDAVEGVAHIGPHILVPVLVHAQRARRVLDEEIDQADFVITDLRELLGDVISNQVRAPRPRRQRKRLLEPGHGGGGGGSCGGGGGLGARGRRG